MATASKNQQVNSIPVGGLLNLPGFTEEFERPDNFTNVSTTLSPSAQTSFNPPASFQKTDVVYWWELDFAMNWAVTYSAGALGLSPQAPYNWLQNLQLKLQGQYSSLNVVSGFHAAFFQQYRPMRGRTQTGGPGLIGVNAAPTTGYGNAAQPEANLIGSQLSSTLTSPYSVANYPFTLELPAGLYFDEYWDLALDGSLNPNAQGVAAPTAAFVSPQYMAGGDRVITPAFNYAPLISTSYDNGPLVATTALTESVETASAVVSARAVGVYSSENPAELPPVYAWQYSRQTQRITVGATTQLDLPLTQQYGQLLSCWAMIFDPSLNSNAGGWYNIANVQNCGLYFGSNLPRYADNPNDMQNRFNQQHGFLPPQGTMVWDMAVKKNGTVSNARAINTLTNANTKIVANLATAPGASTYVYVGTEMLVPVSMS